VATGGGPSPAAPPWCQVGGVQRGSEQREAVPLSPQSVLHAHEDAARSRCQHRAALLPAVHEVNKISNSLLLPSPSTTPNWVRKIVLSCHQWSCCFIFLFLSWCLGELGSSVAGCATCSYGEKNGSQSLQLAHLVLSKLKHDGF